MVQARGSAAERRRVVSEVERFVERVSIKLTLDIHANLVDEPGKGGTPIDLGWASANWVASVGQIDEGPHGDPGSLGQALSAQARGVSEVLAYRLPMGALFISNGVPYIGALNKGHSPQAKAGFVDDAVEKGVNQDLSYLGRSAA